MSGKIPVYRQHNCVRGIALHSHIGTAWQVMVGAGRKAEAPQMILDSLRESVFALHLHCLLNRLSFKLAQI